MRALRQAKRRVPAATGRASLPRAILTVLLLVSACSSTRAPEEGGPPTPAPLARLVVSTTGDDAAPGDDARPLRTLGKALSRGTASIVLLPGTYTEDLTIARDVTIAARDRATLDGRITVTRAALDLTGVDVLRGITAEQSPRVALSTLRVASSSAADALALLHSVAALRNLTLTCGSETCLQAANSTVTADGLTLTRGSVAHKRGLRAETSSVTVRGLRAGGASNIDAQASQGSHLTLVDAELVDITGNAVAALSGSKLELVRARITGTGRVAILLSASDATIRGLDLGPLDPSASGIGIEGGVVRISDSRLQRAGMAAVVVNDHRARPADVRLDGVTIDHGRATAINLGQGKLAVARCELIGDPAAIADGNDAITVSGDTADLTIESATIDAATGHAVGVYNNAGARISARITRPRLGGVLVERSAGAELRITGTTITDCKQGSGVALVDTLAVEIEDLEVTRCPEAGVLAGLGTEVSVRRARLLDNRQYGVAAFGRSTLTLSDSTARGSKWAAFASCADGSVITGGGGNTLEGPTSLCP